MIKIDTKFKIGDKVRSKTETTKYLKIPCPFCDGKGYIDYNETLLYCGECEDGIYEFNYTQMVWGKERTVLGAAIINNFFTHNKDQKRICVSDTFINDGLVFVYCEDDLEFADKVGEGELCE